MLVSGASLDSLRTLVARAFAHATMNEACRAFAATQLPPAVASGVTGPIPADLREVAQACDRLDDPVYETLQPDRAAGHLRPLRIHIERPTHWVADRRQTVR
jgi:hypothetical protein